MIVQSVIIIVSNLKMSHYNNICQGGAANKQGTQEIGSFEKSVMSNSKQSIEKHLSHMKIDQNQLNYALFLSIQHFRLDEHTDQCILLLLRHKANPNCQFNKQTPLTVACRKGQHLLVKVLLQNGAKPDLCNKNGEHPLSVILKDKRQNYDVAQTLISHMNSINFQIGGRNPIVVAVQREFFRIYQMLIEKGANLTYQSENILHIIIKKKFKRSDKKKKFIKQLAGRIYLMQEDSNHKLPTDYEDSEDIKAFILQNFKAKVTKTESIKAQSNSKQLKQKQVKNREHQCVNLKQSKKKLSASKQLDASFSEAEQQQFQQQKGQNAQNKLYEVVEIPEQENKKQGRQSLKINEKELEKEGKKDKSPDKIDGQIADKQREEQKQKIRKKLNASFGIQSKKKNSSNQQGELGLVGSKKKKGKAEQIVPKTLLKRKNSSLEQESIKLDKNKAATIKKQNNLKKQGLDCSYQQRAEKQKGAQEEDKNGSVTKKAKQDEVSFNIEQQKNEKQSETDSEQAYMGSFSTLNQEIYDLVNKIILKNQEKVPIVEQIVKFLDSTLRDQLLKHRENARLQLYIYGSQATGLAIDHSDVDLLVVSDFEPISFMRLLQDKKTFINDYIQEVKFIPGATVPVIKLIMNEKYLFMHVDLTFQNKNHMGLKCSQMIKAFMQAEPLLRPLVLIIKMLVDSYDISDPYKGGLSSYAITLMVIALLQFTQQHKKTVDNVGELLLNFFYFYGQQIDYVSQAIIIHALGLFGQQPVYCIYRLPYFTDLNPKLIIYDPLNPVNNVGRTTFRIAALKRLFSCCYLRLKSQPRCQLKDLFDGSFSELLTDF